MTKCTRFARTANYCPNIMWRSSCLISELSQHVCGQQSVWTHKHIARCVTTKTSDPFTERATEVIDVRAPVEFEHDHIPGALNFPVLDNEQRAHVGEVYNRDSFEARKLGAAMVSRKISEHITSYFVQKTQHYCPLLYCWRGGQRSQSLATILSQIGFDVLSLEGGYRTYRKKVVSDLQVLPQQFKFIVLTGLTGTGKTLLLHTLEQRAAHTLDLEGLARHKGSLLGLWHKHHQPSQKMWESHLRHRLASFDSAFPVWVESESSRVGNLFIPTALFHEMCESERVEVSLPMEQRIKCIIADYPHWIEDVSALKSALQPLKKIRGQKMVESWFQLADKARWEELVEQLLVQHYDPTYSLSQKKNERLNSEKMTVVCLKDLTEKSLVDFAEFALSTFVSTNL